MVERLLIGKFQIYKKAKIKAKNESACNIIIVMIGQKGDHLHEIK